VYFPEVNEATIRVLNAEGCDVVVPRGQGCCGALSVHAGREDEAQSFAREIIERFEKEHVDAVIVNAAGCGSTLKEYGRLFAHDPRWAERGARFANEVKDISEFLVALGARAERHPMELRVACHDACHLAHAQRIRGEPRELLRGIPGVEVCEVPDGDQCCGSAGIYNLLQPDSAREIGARKVENILSTQSQLLASSNPGCTLQIQMMLREQGVSLPALHPIQLLDASIRNRAPLLR
jgi:glycolate oxidase iron-sulfur subunit